MRAPFITTIDFYLFSVAALIRLANWPSSVRVKLYLVNALSFLAYHLSKSKRRLSEQNLSDTSAEGLVKINSDDCEVVFLSLLVGSFFDAAPEHLAQ